MATKSKNTNLSRGVFAWVCYMTTVFALITALVYGAAYFLHFRSDAFNTANRFLEDSKTVLSGELRELNVYKESASALLERLFHGTHSTENAERTAAGGRLDSPYLQNISRDNLYRVTDYSRDPNGITATNDPNWNGKTAPEGFNYLLRCSNGVVKIFYIDTENGLPAETCVFSSESPGAFYTDTLAYTVMAMQSIQNPPDIVFTVRAEPTSFHNTDEVIGAAHNYANRFLFQFTLLSAAALLLLMLPVLSILFRRDRRLFEELLAAFLSHIWIEVKALLFLGVLAVCGLLVFSSGRGELRGGFWGSAGLCFLFLIIHFLVLDLTHNRRIWQQNILHSVLKFISGPKDGKRFEQIQYRKYLAVVAVLLLLGLGTAGVTLLFRRHEDFAHFLPLFYAAVAFAVFGTLLWYAAALRDDLHDYGVLMDQVEKMYGGDLRAANHLPPSSPLYTSAMQLNMIRDGIQIAVNEGIKAEKTKVELITNVSHDIKTPLTSIIGYVELLKAEEDLPEHVKDYVNVIAQKSYRLRHMIQDIFDVSKAATGNIVLKSENLDLRMLLKQTLADMGELMEKSALDWRVNLPTESFPVYVDGQKIYRVFQNLIKNAAQYALEGSRVYISLVKQGGLAVFSMQNITKHELHMDGEALMGRFVRGDDSRTTSGSGLGLSIAKSFAEACGGTLDIQVKGDLFSAEITFPLLPAPEPAPEAAAPEEGA